jgi:PAS domain S-box-containing protein
MAVSSRDENLLSPESAADGDPESPLAFAPKGLHRLLVESVDEYAIFALDPRGNIVSWNKGAERIKGYGAEEIIGKHFSIFYPPERVAQGFPDYELREAARVGRFEDEGWRLRKDGSHFWADVVITALRDQEGKLVGFGKVTRDLTARRRQDEALRESEERFRLLVQGVRDYAIFMLDPTGHVTTWNDGAHRIKGYTAQEIIGKHFSIFYTAEDLATNKPARELEIASATGVYEEEGWRLRKDGSRFWANVVITALRHSDGTLAGFAKVTRDLTERRAAQGKELEAAGRVAAEEAARRVSDDARVRAERLQTITGELSAAHTISEIANVVFDRAMGPTSVAAAALGILDESGNTIRVVAQRGFSKHPWVLPIGIDDNVPMAMAIRTGKPVIYRSRETRDATFPNLSEVLADFVSTAVFPLLSRGKVVGGLSVHREAEEPLNDETIQFLNALAQQVALAVERAGLYQAEQEARARADEANKAKSEFLAAMSHELRTPLNAIAGYADLLAMGVRGPVTPEQVEDLQRIKRSQHHLLGIINDILNFSRIEAGRTTYDCGPVPIHEVMDSVGQMIAPLATSKNITFEIASCPESAVAWADRSKVEQILVNLLSNAIKFTNDGGVTLSCDWKDAKTVSISVSDTGLGIPAEERERIFEPFVQVKRSLTQGNEGTGLGLAISRDLARAMDGEITVTSEPGKGSTFVLRLPRPAAE